MSDEALAARTNCAALLITCSDFRFKSAERAFAESLGLRDDYDLIARPGAIRSLVAPRNEAARETMQQEIAMLWKLHSFPRVIMANHMSCGAYADLAAHEEERGLHLRHLAAAGQGDRAVVQWRARGGVPGGAGGRRAARRRNQRRHISKRPACKRAALHEGARNAKTVTEAATGVNARARRSLDAVLSRFGWNLTEELPAGGGSAFLARVRDRHGRDLLLKRASGLRGYAEYRVLRAWNGDPHVPGDLRYVDYRTHAREWITGEPLGETAVPPAAARDVGEGLCALHARRPPRRIPRLRDLHLAPGARFAAWSGRLPDNMQRRAEGLAFALSAASLPDDALLHGDAVPINVIRSRRGPVFIDPLGFVGPAAWDLAQFSVSARASDPRQTLAQVVRGYGLEPPRLSEMFEWMTYMFLDVHLAREESQTASDAELTRRLFRLARSFDA